MKTKPVTVQQLRAEGFRVQVYVFRLPSEELRGLTTHHWNDQDVISYSRPVTHMRLNKLEMWGFGGVTHMLVWTPEHKGATESGPDYEVQAVCSIKDQFRKKVGMAICLGRLTKAMSDKE